MRHYIRCSWILIRAAVSLTDGLGLDGDRCIRVIPRHVEEYTVQDTHPWLGEVLHTLIRYGDHVLPILWIPHQEGFQSLNEQLWWDEKKRYNPEGRQHDISAFVCVNVACLERTTDGVEPARKGKITISIACILNCCFPHAMFCWRGRLWSLNFRSSFQYFHLITLPVYI